MNKEVVKKGLFIVLILGVFCSFGLRGSGVNDTPQDAKWHWPDSIKDILIIPDSLLYSGDSIRIPMEVYTPEQKTLARALMTVIINYTKMENNHFVFEMSREEFLKTGIPEAYYDKMIHDYKTTNDFIDKDTLGIFPKLVNDWPKAKEEMRLQMDLDVEINME